MIRLRPTCIGHAETHLAPATQVESSGVTPSEKIVARAETCPSRAMRAATSAPALIIATERRVAIEVNHEGGVASVAHRTRFWLAEIP